MEYQQCTKCGKKYPLTRDYFYSRKDRSKGFVSQCKSCSNKRGEEARKKYREKNKDKKKEIDRTYREAHKDEIKEYSIEYRRTHKEKIRENNKRFAKTEKRKTYERKYYGNNKGSISEYGKKYREDNKDKINKYFRDKRANDLDYRIRKNMQSRIQTVVKRMGAIKSDTTANLIGCSMPRFISWLESKFKEGMAWDNYGEWHIDHIKPCAVFDLTQPSEQKECFHYSNLRPLWARENLSKNSRYNGKLIRKED
ncbi:MAG: hypothetical protein WC119_02090 [Synergistaceae bacterium]